MPDLQRKILMVAFHFPPVQGSSGVQRTLSFTRFLPEFGWRPHVLTVLPEAYGATDPGQLADIHPGTIVTRTRAWDSSRHLAVRGRYLRMMARPDQWVSWCLTGIRAGVRIVRAERPDVIWSTFPVATAQLIGLAIARITGVPWVADFRDSMTEEEYPRDPRTRRVCRWIEARAVRHASRSVFTAGNALQMYVQRYPGVDPARFTVIENGYDERIFADIQLDRRRGTDGGPRRLLHSGLVYPEERNPLPLFDAIATLKRDGRICADRINVVFRACGHDARYQREIEQRQIQDIVRLEPPVPYREALQEMADADALLILQSAGCNHQIPAKVYEYFKVGRPIVALTDQAGDTYRTLSAAGHTLLAPLDNPQRIARLLEGLATRWPEPPGGPEPDQLYGRRARTGELVRLFDEVIASAASGELTP